MKTSPPSLREVLIQLAAEGKLTKEWETDAEVILREPSGFSPWYVKLLTAISAWLAVLLLLIFIYGTRIVASDTEALVSGSILIAAAAVLTRFVKGEFLRQISLALSLTGQVLLLFALTNMFGIKEAAGAGLVLELVLLLIYPDDLHRFLTVVLATLAAMVLIYELKMPETLHALIISYSVVVVMLSLGNARCMSSIASKLCVPVNYALVTALFITLIPSAIFGMLTNDIVFPYPYVSTLGMGILLLVLEWHLLSSNHIPRNSSQALGIFIGTTLFLIPAAQAPGLLAAVIILLLGFHLGNRILIGMALGYLFVFLSAYYYHLEISLLMKSLSLVGGGLVLLSLRIFFRIGQSGVEAS